MTSGLLTGFAIFAVLFFAVAAVSQWQRIPGSFWERPAVFALAFIGASGMIFFFGAIELVGRYGVSGLFGLAAFTGIYALSPLFLDPLRWISRSHAFSTLPDLLVYRFRAPAVSRASGALLALACLPIAAAQIRIVAGLAPAESIAEFWVMASVAVAALVFTGFFGKPSRAITAIPGVTLCTTLLGIVSVFGCGYLALDRAFGGLQEMNQWAETTRQDDIIMRFDSAYALILLFFPAAFILPQQGFMITLSNWWPRNSPSAWMIPLAMLLLTLPLFPILWAGLELEIEAPLQYYILALPELLGYGWLTQIALITLLFIATCLLSVTALALAKIVVTTWVIGKETHLGNTDLDHWLNSRQRAAAAIWLLCTLGFASLVKTDSVTDLTITGMIGVIQLLPGIIATLYVASINHKGFLAGLAVGSLFWLYGIAAPVCFDTPSPSLFGFNLAVGTENWQFWLLESLVANLLTALVVSITTKSSAEERAHAYHCMVDNLPTPQRQSLATTSVEKIRHQLAENIGKPAAERELTKVCGELQITPQEQRPLVLRMLRDRLSFNLSAKLGTLASETIMGRVMPFGAGPTVDDITLLESQLASAGSDLSGLAAELNKLRLYHRQTLENLPTGVCSIDPEGEVLLWNHAFSGYTGLPSSEVEGGNIGDIPQPWGDLLQSFVMDRETSWPVHEVAHPQRGTCWFNLSKHRIGGNSPLYSGYQVILMEDITERFRLVQELAHAERLTSVGRLAAGVAHEIGNPVTGISCLAQDMLEESSDSETVKSAEIILSLTDRIDTIVRTLMDFSRSDSQDALRGITLKPAVENAVQLLKLDRGAKPVEFRAEIAEDLQVWGNQHQLTQVFVNLLSNARDASNDGDPIEVSADIASEHHVSVTVTDYGSGIPEEFIDRVMDPFFTTKDPGEGTGLGLSLVYSIMRFHKGRVTMASPVRNGRGTRVTLLLNRP